MKRLVSEVKVIVPSLLLWEKNVINHIFFHCYFHILFLGPLTFDNTSNYSFDLNSRINYLEPQGVNKGTFNML